MRCPICNGKIKRLSALKMEEQEKNERAKVVSKDENLYQLPLQAWIELREMY